MEASFEHSERGEAAVDCFDASVQHMISPQVGKQGRRQSTSLDVLDARVSRLAFSPYSLPSS